MPGVTDRSSAPPPLLRSDFHPSAMSGKGVVGAGAAVGPGCLSLHPLYPPVWTIPSHEPARPPANAVENTGYGRSVKTVPAKSGRRETRTPDILRVKQTLYQLS